MSFVQHEPCPNCGSRDNLARYSDGSAYCFGCKYKESSTKDLKEVKRRYCKITEDNNKYGISLPYDYSTSFTKEALSWLYKYEITSQEICKHGFGYSDTSSGIVMPFLCNGNVVGYQIRYLSGEKRYRIFGDKLQMSLSFYSRLDSGRGTLVLCEDVLSAIKISRIVPAVPLFGCNVPLELIKTYLPGFKSYGVWLDPDKRKDAVRQALNLRQFGISLFPIWSDKDPKELSTQEIKKALDIGNIK